MIKDDTSSSSSSDNIYEDPDYLPEKIKDGDVKDEDDDDDENDEDEDDEDDDEDEDEEEDDEDDEEIVDPFNKYDEDILYDKNKKLKKNKFNINFFINRNCYNDEEECCENINERIDNIDTKKRLRIIRYSYLYKAGIKNKVN